MREQQLARENEQTMRNIQKKKEEEARLAALDAMPTRAQLGAAPVPIAPAPVAAAQPSAGEKRRNRWDQGGAGGATAAADG
eukprot:1181737-Prorocentrum_minimum.AAC.6